MKDDISSWDEAPLFMSLSTAGKIVGLNANYLSVLVRKNQFPAFKIGDSWRVDKEELRAYIEKRKALQKDAG